MNDFILTLMMLGAMSSGANMPFWSTANRFGLMPEANGGIAYVAASSQYDPSKTIQWRWGASLAAGYDSCAEAAGVYGVADHTDCAVSIHARPNAERRCGDSG